MAIGHLKQTRREFLAISAAAGSVAFSLSIPAVGRAAVGGSQGIEVHSWVVIHADNRVTVRIPQSEIGQGASTALTQIIADEIGLDLPMVDWEFYDPQTNRIRNNVYVHTATLASWGVEKLFDPMRTAGAQIRKMLLDAAAMRLGVPADALVFDNHAIRESAGGESIGFGALADIAATLPVPPAAAVTTKPRSEWRYIGKSVARNDGQSKCTGQAVYGIDVILPGMKYAAVKQSPVFGGRLRSFDAQAIRNFSGVVNVVRINAGPSGYTVPPTLWDVIDWAMDDAVAVVADSWWQAQRALDALPIEWDEGPNATADSVRIDSDLIAALDKPGQVVRNEGDVAAALAAAVTVIEADYHYPFVEHATLEPMNCTAVVHERSVEAWAPTQYGDEALRIAAYAAGVALKDAKFHLTLAGGGFGRRLHNDYVSQAVQIAKQMRGTPVKLIWSREENTRRSYYPPVMTARFRGGLNENGEVIAWQSHVAQGRSVFQPYGMTRLVFPVPNIEVRYSTIETPAPFAWMRGVGHTQNAWMNHGFMSELAEQAGMDSLSFQLRLLDENNVAEDRADYDDAVARIRRCRRLLSDVADKAGPSLAAAAGRGRGIAVYDMSYVPGFPSPCIAVAVDVRLDGKGGIRVEKVVACVDCGLAINPDLVEAQIQGGVMFGISNALYGKITITEGRVKQSNFHDYPILRLKDSPRVEVHVLPSGDHPSGVGEGPVPVVIGALVDAIHAAGGPRIRSLPIMDNLVSAAN